MGFWIFGAIDCNYSKAFEFFHDLKLPLLDFFVDVCVILIFQVGTQDLPKEQENDAEGLFVSRSANRPPWICPDSLNHGHQAR
jgi:hypothetical protein